MIRAALTDLANTLRDKGAVDESECYIDAAFASAKGGSEEIGPARKRREKHNDSRSSLFAAGRHDARGGAICGLPYRPAHARSA